MSVTKLNKYQGKWAPNTNLYVDAPDMVTAVSTMVATNGDEPNIVQLVDENILGVINSTKVKFTINVEPTGSGIIYPKDSEVDANQSVLFTAVPSMGYVFDHYEMDDVAYDGNPCNIRLTKDSTINAVFKVDQKYLNTCYLWVSNSDDYPENSNYVTQEFIDGSLSRIVDFNDQYLIIVYDSRLPELSEILLNGEDILQRFTTEIVNGRRCYISNSITQNDANIQLVLDNNA